jgi:hypothetical protein
MTTKRPATKDRINYRTQGALFAARFAADVRELVKAGFSKTEAKRLALIHSEACDIVVQNPDGTFRFYESEPGDDLALLPSPPTAKTKP